MGVTLNTIIVFLDMIISGNSRLKLTKANRQEELY